jgi:hypothetical protein
MPMPMPMPMWMTKSTRYQRRRKVVAPVKRRRQAGSLRSRLATSWVCCEQHFSDEDDGAQPLCVHSRARPCPHAKNGCPESFVGGLDCSATSACAMFKNEARTCAGAGSPGASTAASRRIYVDSLNRHSRANHCLPSGCRPPRLSVYSAAAAASLVDSDSGDAESMKLAVSRPLNGKRRDADALRRSQIKRFTSVADRRRRQCARRRLAGRRARVCSLLRRADLDGGVDAGRRCRVVVGVACATAQQYFAMATHDVKTPLMRPRTPSDGVGRVIQIWRASTHDAAAAARRRASKPVCSAARAPLWRRARAQVVSARLGAVAAIDRCGSACSRW